MCRKYSLTTGEEQDSISESFRSLISCHPRIEVVELIIAR